jgi:hypothetical protein
MADRRALLIGICKYPKFPPERQLHGCVNDVDLMEGTLRDHFGFPAANIRVLRDEEATRDAILAAMDALVAATGPDDVVVFQFSGHGSQIRDRERDEADGWDETIVAHDSGRAPEPNRDITDDEIYLRLRDLGQRTGHITLLFDCCHSGTITRDAFGGASRWLPPDERPVEELPPSPIPPGELEGLRAAERNVGPSRYLPLGDRYVLIAGCRDEESSYEYPPRAVAADTIHGTLTYFLHQELIQAGAGTTYRDVFERVQALVTGAYPNQHPQMEGARDKELFGVREIEPMRFVRVAGRLGDVVTLAAGAAHGLTVGSKWALYPQGTKVAVDGASLGSAEIATVRGQTSDARLLPPAGAPAVAAGCRAVEVEHDYGDLTLKLEVADAPPGLEAERAALTAQLEGSLMVREAGGSGSADARAYLLAPRSGAFLTDPVPQIGALAEATWAVVGGGGQLLMPARPAREPSSVIRIRENLEKIARYRNLLAVRNPDPAGPLKDSVDFILLRRAAGGPWEEAVPDDSGRIVYRAGEPLAFRIKNRHTAPIYAHVLDFGVTFGVSLIYPIRGSNERHMPNVTVEYGVRSGEELELFLPDELVASDEGLETLKLIATTQEVDFSWMEQGRVRSLPRTISPLDQLLRQTGERTRDTRPKVVVTEEWTTRERPFVLKRS